MTKDIVQSDIDLAQQLIDARRRDEEIIIRLRRRGISQDHAEELVDALREGRPFIPIVAAAQTIPEAERIGFSPSPDERSRADDAIAARPARGQGGRGSRALFVAAVLLATALGGWYYWYHAQTHALLLKLEESQPATGPGPGADQQPELIKQLQGRNLSANEQAMFRTLVDRMGATPAARP